MDGELDVRPAGFHADGPDDLLGLVAHGLIFVVGQRLLGRHGDRVAGVHAHRIKVLDGADDDHVVRLVAHHLQLELLPSHHRLFDQDAMHRREIEAASDDIAQFFDVVRDPAAGSTERERRADD